MLHIKNAIKNRPKLILAKVCKKAMTIIKTNISGIFLIVSLNFRKARGHNLPLSTIFIKLINNCRSTRKSNP